MRFSTAFARAFGWSVLLSVAIGCSTIATPGIPHTPTSSMRLTDTPPSLETSLAVTTSPSPAPLSQQAMASCPVSRPRPGIDLAPGAKYPYVYYYYNDERTLFTDLWPEGKVIFRPGGPGSIEPDGSLAMKWPWHRYNIKGQVVVEGRRLDASAPPLRAWMGCCRSNTATPDCCYGDTGFISGALIFPTEGCWEVTARVGSHTLTFVTLAVKVTQ